MEKEEKKRRKAAEEKMRQHIIIEMEEKALQETAEKMRVFLSRPFSANFVLSLGVL